MNRTAWLALLVAATLSACAQPTPEQQIVNDAAAALGGRDRILAVKTLVIEGEGTNGNLGQDMTPDATGADLHGDGYKRAIDVPAGRVRIEQTRTPNFTYFQGQPPQKQVLGVDGDVGYNVAPNGNATRAANAVAKDRRAEIYHHPITIVRAALDPAAMLVEPEHPGQPERRRRHDARTGSCSRWRSTDTTKLPTRVVSMTDNTNLGDVAIETSFADYQDVNGLKLPARLTTKTDKYTTAELRVTNADRRRRHRRSGGARRGGVGAACLAPPPAMVTVAGSAPGIWWLAGRVHHSVLVEFADHMTLIEAPQNDTRALAVIAKAQRDGPDKPLTHVVNSHHHFDHSGGIRAAVSEGLTVVAHESQRAVLQDAVATGAHHRAGRAREEPQAGEESRRSTRDWSSRTAR